MAKKILDPDAGTDGPHPSWDIQGQQGEPGIPDDPPEPKPKRGRPRCVEEPLGPITVHLPIPTQDRIHRLASRRKQPVSEYLRDVIGQLFGGRP